MKYLLVLLVVVIAVGIWRSKRRVSASEHQSATPEHNPAPRQLQNMVACAHCGLHLPQSDSVSGQSGVFFCCTEHRELASQSGAKT